MSRKIEFGLCLVVLVSYGCIQNAEGSGETSTGTTSISKSTKTDFYPADSAETYETTVSNDECIGTLWYW